MPYGYCFDMALHFGRTNEKIRQILCLFDTVILWHIFYEISARNYNKTMCLVDMVAICHTFADAFAANVAETLCL